MAKTIGYIRVITDRQNTDNQKMAILEFGNKEKLPVDDWIEVTASSRKKATDRKLDQLMVVLSAGDTLLVSELSRLGRSVGQIVILVNELIDQKVNLICIKENIRIAGKQDMQTKVMVTMFSLMAEIERDLISERTKEGLARAKAEGKLIGRPRGSGKSKLDEHADKILDQVKQRIPKKVIAENFSVSPGALRNWLNKRG